MFRPYSSTPNPIPDHLGFFLGRKAFDAKRSECRLSTISSNLGQVVNANPTLPGIFLGKKMVGVKRSYCSIREDINHSYYCTLKAGPSGKQCWPDGPKTYRGIIDIDSVVSYQAINHLVAAGSTR